MQIEFSCFITFKSDTTMQITTTLTNTAGLFPSMSELKQYLYF